MDYMPPPQIQEFIIQVAQKTKSAQKQLIINVDDAIYSMDGEEAKIKMYEAFQKQNAIQIYNGVTITLVYKDYELGQTACPLLNVPLKNIRRSINFLENSVTLTVSNITKKVADEIETSKCLVIDTDTVKKVSNPNYQKKIPSKENTYKSLNQ